jgi:hypothetical protein
MLFLFTTEERAHTEKLRGGYCVEKLGVDGRTNLIIEMDL